VNKTYVLSESYERFNSTCIVDWRESPRDPKFVVMTTNDAVITRMGGRVWNEGDRAVVLGWPKRHVRAEFIRQLQRMGAPEENWEAYS
jgi:hypothetical protein